jgi:hypothetical protein
VIQSNKVRLGRIKSAIGPDHTGTCDAGSARGSREDLDDIWEVLMFGLLVGADCQSGGTGDAKSFNT